MSRLPLAPVVGSVQAATDYLAVLPVDDPVRYEQGVLSLLDSLLRVPPQPDVLFGVLERLRAGVGRVREELARHYSQRPVPLSELETLAFLRCQAVLQRMAQAYALCAQRVDMPPPSSDAQQFLAEVLQRCLYYNGRLIFEHYRACRELVGGCWLAVHAAYKVAEELSLAERSVTDRFMASAETCCLATYASILLSDLAGPASQGARNIDMIRRWAELWSSKAQVLRPPVSEERTLPIHLDRDVPLCPAEGAGETTANLRLFDIRAVGREARHALAKLKKTSRPEQLGLGEEPAGKVIHLLQSLVAPWSQSLAVRRFRRFASDGQARLTSGLEAIYQQVAGQPFVAQDSRQAYSRGDHVQLHIFRDKVAAAVVPLDVAEQTESWRVLNHSASGFRLRRDGPGHSLQHGQLVAVCPPDSKRFFLAHVTWLVENQAGALVCGLSILPGLPQALAVRLLPLPSEGVPALRYAVAFKLPAVPGVGEEPSLVLPLGLYQASRTLETRQDKRLGRLRMLNILQRGSDFDRVSYSDA
ncbi:MAG: hypothetical protein PHT48_02940 [Dechloromonas sp.]|nr:hypothetical protein [Dechloromonas sp.]